MLNIFIIDFNKKKGKYVIKPAESEEEKEREEKFETIEDAQGVYIMRYINALKNEKEKKKYYKDPDEAIIT